MKKRRQPSSRKPPKQFWAAWRFSQRGLNIALVFAVTAILCKDKITYRRITERIVEREATTLEFNPPEDKAALNRQISQECIFNKVEEINWLNRKLNGLPDMSPKFLRPVFMQSSPSNVPDDVHKKETEKSLDQEIERLKNLLDARQAAHG